MYIVKAGEIKYKLPSNYFFANDIELANYIYNGLKPGWEFPEYSLVRWCEENFIKQDKNFIDIGAHCGTWSCTLAEKANHTYSFECSPDIYNCLCANIFLKRLSYKTTTFNCALSNRSGNSDYYIRSTDGGGNGIEFFPEQDKNCLDVLKVRTFTLDSLNIDNVNFIKIDVEGHEKQVLQGAIKTLENNNYPKIVFESWTENKEKQGVPSIQLRKDLFSYIESLEYKIIPINGFPESFLATR